MVTKRSFFYCWWRHKFRNNQNISVTSDSYLYLSSTRRTHCCNDTVTMVTRTRHDVTLYVYCLPCSLIAPPNVQQAYNLRCWKPESRISRGTRSRSRSSTDTSGCTKQVSVHHHLRQCAADITLLL